jgi:ABC-type multidrug transport system ATPase subunit
MSENTLKVSTESELHVIWKCVGMSAGFSQAEGTFKDLNLDIHSGERVALLGEANSGKALLLRCLVGLRPSRGGEFHVFGQKMETLPFWADWENIVPQNLRRRMGICLEEEGLLSNVSVREGLELLFRFKYGDHNQKLRDGASKIVTNTCARFGLGEAIQKRPNMLTVAERRLAGIARAYLSKPHVVVLENPSQSVGDLSKEHLWKALDYINEEKGRTVVISTEDWLLASRYCPRWVVMHKGVIDFDGKASEFLASAHPLAVNYHRLREMEKMMFVSLKEAA